MADEDEPPMTPAYSQEAVERLIAAAVRWRRSGGLDENQLAAAVEPFMVIDTE